MNISVKFKVLFTVITLSVMGVVGFGALSFSTYKKDKLSFIYEYLSKDNQNRATFFASVSEDYEFLMSSIIPKISDNSKVSYEEQLSFLRNGQKKVGGLYYLKSSSPEPEVLFEASYLKTKSWKDLDLIQLPKGLSIIDKQNGYFVFKKTVEEKGEVNGHILMVFRHTDLWKTLGSENGASNLILSRTQVISKDALPFPASTLKALYPTIKNYPGSFGLFETELEGTPHFVTYSNLGDGNEYLVSFIETSKVLLVQDTLLKQNIAFLILMASISLLIGAIAARWLTLHLDELKNGALAIEQEEFDVKIPVTSRDEFGVLGQAFNNMGTRLKNLLDELRRYNLELEDKVRERTKELQNLTDIQNGMVNALGQGFVIVDKEHRVLPVYSKVAETMFETVPDKAEPGVIMGLPEEERSNFRELFEMTFGEMIEFEDMAKLAPDLRTNSRNERIQLSYAPILNADDSFEYVLVIGTDKTAEFENLEKFNREWNFSQMILKVASNRSAVNKIIKETFSMLDECLKRIEEKGELYARHVQRLVHTIKGSFSYFHVQEMTTRCHDLESFLGRYYEEGTCPPDIELSVIESVLGIQATLESFVERFESILKYKNEATTKTVSLSELEKFASFLDKKDPDLRRAFEERFFRVEVSSYFQLYDSLVSDLCGKLGKEARFSIEGGDVLLPEGPWGEVFQQFVHFIRNSLDHGLELPDERRALGKDPQGHISFNFSRSNNDLHILLKDDGKGVEWEKIAAKDSSVTCLEDALNRIRTGGISSKDAVTDVSGRGVGVSSLFQVIEKFGGKAEFRSRAGQGTEIEIRLSLELNSKKPLLKVAS